MLIVFCCIIILCGLQVINDSVPDSYNTHLDDFVYHVPLSPPFTSVSALCFVWGCYEETTLDSIFEYLLIDNVTCEYKGTKTLFSSVLIR